MARFWEKLRGSQRLKGGFLFSVVALLVIAAALLPSRREAPLADAERLAFDLQMRALRMLKPRPLADDVVLVGINDDTEAAYPEPIALWHRHFALAYHGLALAKPRAVGVDIVLPEHTYDFIVPGSDFALMRGLVELKRSAPFVFVQTANRHGDLVPVQENYTNSIVTPANLG